MNDDFILCGWRVHSNLSMPELLPWINESHPVDIEISIGIIPKCTDAPTYVRPHSRLWANGTFLLELDAVGRFWVEGGRRVIVQPAPSANEAEVRGFILGSVLGALCHQRGLLPIHASAVRIDGRAILIAGNSGAGKSTLAAALGVRGHALVADDVAAFDPSTSMILPAFPQRKLAVDVMEALSLDNVGMIPNRPGQPKFRIPASVNFDSAPLMPSAVYILTGILPAKSGEIERQSMGASMAHIDKMTYRRGIGAKIQAPQKIFRAIEQLSKIAPVHAIASRRDQPMTSLAAFAERVEAHALAARH